jgi:hypothetical protein
MTRDEALALVQERDGLFPRRTWACRSAASCNRIGITEAKLMETLDRFTNWALFDGDDGKGRPVLREFAEA